MLELLQQSIIPISLDIVKLIYEYLYILTCNTILLFYFLVLMTECH